MYREGNKRILLRRERKGKKTTGAAPRSSLNRLEARRVGKRIASSEQRGRALFETNLNQKVKTFGLRVKWPFRSEGCNGMYKTIVKFVGEKG